MIVIGILLVLDVVVLSVFLSISPPLEHDPLSIAHVTVDLEGLHTSRVNSVDPILSTSSLIDLLTVMRYWVSMQGYL